MISTLHFNLFGSVSQTLEKWVGLLHFLKVLPIAGCILLDLLLLSDVDYSQKESDLAQIGKQVAEARRRRCESPSIVLINAIPFFNYLFALIV